ncbi:MAG: hypothetical protein IJV40_09165 [Oscillospiraceae bacterium]|nr:hypothetical protein [Oscillospiraceae bacterium]
MNGKKLVAVLLCIVMLASLFPTAAFAEEAPESILEIAEMMEQEEPTAEAMEQSPPEEAEHVPSEPEIPEYAEPETIEYSEPETPAVAEEVQELILPAETEPAVPVREPVCVVFNCSPSDAVVTVYDSFQTDETGIPLEIEPEEDGTWHLLPGVYYYDVSAEGFEEIEKTFWKSERETLSLSSWKSC